MTCVYTQRRDSRQLKVLLYGLVSFSWPWEELLVWLKQTNATLDEQLARNVQGDVKFIEVEKAKHKVIVSSF